MKFIKAFIVERLLFCQNCLSWASYWGTRAAFNLISEVAHENGNRTTKGIWAWPSVLGNLCCRGDIFLMYGIIDRSNPCALSRSVFLDIVLNFVVDWSWLGHPGIWNIYYTCELCCMTACQTAQLWAIYRFKAAFCLNLYQHTTNRPLAIREHSGLIGNCLLSIDWYYQLEILI